MSSPNPSTAPAVIGSGNRLAVGGSRDLSGSRSSMPYVNQRNRSIDDPRSHHLSAPDSHLSPGSHTWRQRTQIDTSDHIQLLRPRDLGGGVIDRPTGSASHFCGNTYAQRRFTIGGASSGSVGVFHRHQAPARPSGLVVTPEDPGVVKPPNLGLASLPTLASIPNDFQAVLRQRRQSSPPPRRKQSDDVSAEFAMANAAVAADTFGSRSSPTRSAEVSGYSNQQRGVASTTPAAANSNQSSSGTAVFSLSRGASPEITATLTAGPNVVRPTPLSGHFAGPKIGGRSLFAGTPQSRTLPSQHSLAVGMPIDRAKSWSVPEEKVVRAHSNTVNPSGSSDGQMEGQNDSENPDTETTSEAEIKRLPRQRWRVVCHAVRQGSDRLERDLVLYYLKAPISFTLLLVVATPNVTEEKDGAIIKPLQDLLKPADDYTPPFEGTLSQGPGLVTYGPPIQVFPSFGSPIPKYSTPHEFVIGRSYQGLDHIPMAARRWFSRRHCVIQSHLAKFGQTGETFFILRDLHSANGTYLNGRTISTDSSVPLHHGDLIGVSMTDAGALMLGFRFLISAVSERVWSGTPSAVTGQQGGGFGS